MGLLAWIFGERPVEPVPRMDADARATAFGDIALGVQQEQERLRKETEEARVREEQERKRRAAQCPRGWGNEVRYSVRCLGSSWVDESRSFRCVLMRMVGAKCGGRASECYRRAGLSRQLYSRIISEHGKGVNKQTVMRLAIGLKLTSAEAQQFLVSAGYAFSPAIYEDAVFAWCISHGQYSIFDVNDLLVKGGCKPMTIG